MDQRVLSEIPISGRKLTDSFGREWTIRVTDAIGSAAENAPYVLELEIGGPETVRVAREAGCEAYLRKPLDVDKLPALALGYLARSRDVQA